MSRLAELSPGILVATSRRYTTTSTVLVGAHGEAVVVDPAWDPDELEGLADEIAGRDLTVVAGVSTHFHHDHLLWHPALGNAERWASASTVATARDHRDELVEQLGPGWPVELAEVFGRVDPITGPELVAAGLRLEVVVHDAHAAGHLALWEPDRCVLIAGDMLSDVELPLPAPDDHGLVAYATGLTTLAPYARRARLLIPGHGHPTGDGQARYDADRRYLDGVLAGRPCEDPRLANAGMAEAHQQTMALR